MARFKCFQLAFVHAVNQQFFSFFRIINSSSRVVCMLIFLHYITASSYLHSKWGKWRLVLSEWVFQKSGLICWRPLLRNRKAVMHQFVNLLLLLWLHSSTQAVDRSKFKSCTTSGFCKLVDISLNDLLEDIDECLVSQFSGTDSWFSLNMRSYTTIAMFLKWFVLTMVGFGFSLWTSEIY